MFNNYVDIGPRLLVILFLFIGATVFTANPLFTAIAIVTPVILAKLLWKKNEPPFLFLAMILQWVQVSIKVFYADIQGIDFTEAHLYPDLINRAYILSIFAILIQSLGIFLINNNRQIVPLNSADSVIHNYDIKRITLLYIATIVFSPIIVIIAFSSGGLQQLIMKLLDLKWAIFFVFYITVFVRDEKVKWFYLIFCIEIILGFTGYFSSFKDYFFFVAIAYLSLHKTLKPHQFAVLTFAIIIVFNMMTVWQSVKSDYRSFLSGGETMQIVTVGPAEALTELYSQVSEFDGEAYNDGLDRLVNRASYIDFFSAAQSHVPFNLPHENGKLWKDAILKIFMPRILFPNKPAIDDSEKTRKYTGMAFSGAEQGVSISLGYVAESYVDFGPTLMFVPLFLFGLTIGIVYSYIVQNSYNNLWGYALVSPLFFHLSSYETSLDKMIGGLIAFFLVYLIFKRFVIEALDLFMTKLTNKK